MTVLRCHVTATSTIARLNLFARHIWSVFPVFSLVISFVFCVPSENATLIPVIVSAMRWSWTSYVIFIYYLYIIYIHIYISILLLGVDCSVIWLTFVVMSYGQLVFIYYSAVCSNNPTGSHILTRSLKHGSRRRFCKDPELLFLRNSTKSSVTNFQYILLWIWIRLYEKGQPLTVQKNVIYLPYPFYVISYESSKSWSSLQRTTWKSDTSKVSKDTSITIRESRWKESASKRIQVGQSHCSLTLAAPWKD